MFVGAAHAGAHADAGSAGSAPRRYTLPASWIGQSARVAAREGVDLRSALVPLGLPFAADGELAGDLDPVEAMLMCIMLVNAVDDELHGLSRSRMARGTASMSAKAIASAKTLEGAIATLCRFYDMVGGVCRFQLRTDGEEASLQVCCSRCAEGERGLVEELLAHTVHIQLSYFFGALLPLTRLSTSTTAHPLIGSLHPYLLCPVVPGTVTSMVFPTRLLAAQSRGVQVDLPLWEAGRFWLARHPATSGAAHETHAGRPITAALLDLLKRADMSVARCSDELSLNLQELRRELATEGTSFRQIRRTALLERARPHLLNGCSVDDLAWALGYSDARSFRRALKLATGQSISDLRHEAIGDGADRSPLFAQLRNELARLE